MKILIDGDSCPVLDIAERLAFRRAVECTVVHDTDHELHPEHSEQIMVDKGPDSADFRIMNLVQPGDIVVTQDIKLAGVLTSMGLMSWIMTAFCIRIIPTPMRDSGCRNGHGSRTLHFITRFPI